MQTSCTRYYTYYRCTRPSEETFLLTFGVFDLLAALHPLAYVRAFPVGRAKRESVPATKRGSVSNGGGEGNVSCKLGHARSWVEAACIVWCREKFWHRSPTWTAKPSKSQCSLDSSVKASNRSHHNQKLYKCGVLRLKSYHTSPQHHQASQQSVDNNVKGSILSPFPKPASFSRAIYIANTFSTLYTATHLPK